ncbi:MAG TPA: MBL fold metallo-hydrolase [Gemmatimonadales bacterium]|nr:MBL fold metallo-hydrolase [Gemmatimonadales bacterium]
MPSPDSLMRTLDRRAGRESAALHTRIRGLREVTPDLAYLRLALVNVYFFGRRGARDREWVLVDAGTPGSAHAIERAARARFSWGARPSAIVLTHGHFDHVGALRDLAERWDVPVYAHALELPYITGQEPYPPADPTVGGGLLALMSPLYPRGPFDVRRDARALPDDGRVPGMPGWRWIHTPGHSRGHVSLFRDADRLLIAGDAFITQQQESLLAVLGQRVQLHGPPKYFTPDWVRARDSVRALAALDPMVAATGHGQPLIGEAMRRGLERLAWEFDRLAVPEHGRYVAIEPRGPARALAPRAPQPAAAARAGTSTVVLGVAAMAAAGAAAGMLASRH